MIGFAGSDDKVKWLTDDLKFDAAFNYKTTDITTALKEAAPEGVDCYFDNVSVFQKQAYKILRQTTGLLRSIILHPVRVPALGITQIYKSSSPDSHVRASGLQFNPLKPELNPICYLLALLGAHHFLHVSRIRVKLLTLR